MLTVHHLNESRSQRILWLLEELAVPYEIRNYQRDSKTMLAPAGLKAVHPLGKSPVITDGDTVLAESGAIVETLIDRYDTEGRLRPKDEASLIQYRYWLHFAEGTAMPTLLLKLIFTKLETDSPFLVRPLMAAISAKVHSLLITPNFNAQFALIEDTLGKSRWLAGEELSGADIQMSYVVEAVASRFHYKGGPNFQRYLAQMRSRPAYQRAIERGGPFFS